MYKYEHVRLLGNKYRFQLLLGKLKLSLFEMQVAQSQTGRQRALFLLFLERRLAQHHPSPYPIEVGGNNSPDNKGHRSDYPHSQILRLLLPPRLLPSRLHQSLQALPWSAEKYSQLIF
jgi:hypothetical protein